MKRVLLVAFGFPPTSSAGVFRTLRYAKYLQEFGWEPLILTVDNDASRRDFDESLLEPLSPDLVVCRTGIRAHDETVKKWINLGEGKSALAALPPASDQTTRAANESRWVAWTRSLRDLVLYTPDERIGWRSPAVSAARAMIEKYAPSVVYSTGPPHSTHVIASSISRSANLPLVADFRDPWARALWQAARNPWGVKLHPYFERRLVRRASQVILNTSRLADDFEQTLPRVSGQTHRYPQWLRSRSSTNGVRAPAKARRARPIHPLSSRYVVRSSRPETLAGGRSPDRSGRVTNLPGTDREPRPEIRAGSMDEVDRNERPPHGSATHSSCEGASSNGQRQLLCPTTAGYPFAGPGQTLRNAHVPKTDTDAV